MGWDPKVWEDPMAFKPKRSYIIIYKLRGLLGVLPIMFFCIFQSYVKHDLRKNKIVIPFFC
jgi:hypothetical protein